MKRKKKLLVYGIFFLLVLGGFFIALSATKGFFEVKLPTLGYIQNFRFIDQDGKPITDKDVRGKVYVTEYFFTTCTGICPKMNMNMTAVYNKFKNDPDFAIVSHTSMPETDSVPLLKGYEHKMLGNETNGPAHWYFVTGPKDSLYEMARQSYMLDDPKNSSSSINESFIHTQFFALVDRQMRLRGIYDGLKKDEIALLEKDIQGLLTEKN